MQRGTLLFLTFSATLAASTLHAFPVQGGGSGGRATSVRTRCPRPSCGLSSDSATRAKQEQLFYRIDSLRWQFENNARLSEAERERVGAELQRTFLALQESLDQTVRAELAFERVGPAQRPTPSAMGGGRVAIAMPACRTPGYLGVTFDGLNEDECRNNERIVRFFEYPRVALVARSSPAERAGIVVGDTVVAFNGADVTRETISFSKLLVPESRLIVRVRREGDAKDLAVIVGEAPSYYVMRSAPLPAVPPRPASPDGPERVRVQAVPPARAAPPGFSTFVWSGGDGIAGARVESITEGTGLARTIGVKQGLLVLSADPGTPAHQSGLRDGDVILKAAGRNVATIRGLLSVLRNGNGDDGVKLVVLRERKERDVTLRW